MERFLRYSLERNKAIRVIYLDADGRMRQTNAVVEAMENGLVTLYIMRPPSRVTLPASDILGASYTAKDEG